MTDAPFPTLAAALPVATLLALLLGLRWTTVRAAAAGLAAACLSAAFAFGASPPLIAAEALRGARSSVSIIIVIVPAVLLLELSLQAGVFPAIRRALTRLFPDRLLRILALGWCFSSVRRGPGGFGAPVAVTAPILAATGVKPLWAVVIPLAGHGWGTTFGTFAMAWEALAGESAAAPEEWRAAAFWAGLFLLIANALAGAFLCWAYAGLKGLRHGAPAVAALGLAMGGGEMLLAPVLPSFAVVLPSLAAMGAAFLLAKLPRYAGGGCPDSPLLDPGRAEADAGLPPDRFRVRGSLSAAGAARAAARTLRKAFPASLSVVFLLCMSRIMAGSGQTHALARFVAGATGSAYGMLSPFVGLLGAFLSGSNVSSNILFARFQAATASFTGFDLAVVLAAQTAGGALGCMVSPGNVLLGATTAGVGGGEGAIIRRVARVPVLCAAVIGCLVMAFGRA